MMTMSFHRLLKKKTHTHIDFLFHPILKQPYKNVPRNVPREIPPYLQPQGQSCELAGYYYSRRLVMVGSIITVVLW